MLRVIWESQASQPYGGLVLPALAISRASRVHTRGCARSQFYPSGHEGRRADPHFHNLSFERERPHRRLGCRKLCRVKAGMPKIAMREPGNDLFEQPHRFPAQRDNMRSRQRCWRQNPSRGPGSSGKGRGQVRPALPPSRKCPDRWCPFPARANRTF
jgi:hypothetical protein